MRSRLLAFSILLLANSAHAETYSLADAEKKCQDGMEAGKSLGATVTEEEYKNCVRRFTGDEFNDGLLETLLSRHHHSQPQHSVPSVDGTPVYNASDCIGAVVNGKCHGSIGGAAIPIARCHGEMINGQCTGPMF
jgi:hypothetical protein